MSSLSQSLLLTLAAATTSLSGCQTDEMSPSYNDDRADHNSRDVVAMLNSWNIELSQEDIQSKYCKMASSAFVFYRGTNHIYWSDFANDPFLTLFGNAQTQTWIQGDLHAYNFGAFDNDEGKVVYSLNDFDETIIADYQFDLWRMAASIALIARENGNLSEKRLGDVIDEFSDSYLDTMEDFVGNTDENDLIFTRSEFDEPLRSFMGKVKDKKSRLKALEKWTVVDGGDRKFNMDLDRLAPVDSLLDADIRFGMASYGESLSGGLDFEPEYFKIKSIAKRLLAGTGSLGTPRYYVLIEGETEEADDDRILDVKRQSEPTPLRFLSEEHRQSNARAFGNHAERHTKGYKALATKTDDHLGSMFLGEQPYSVRERSVYKESLETAEELRSTSDYKASAQAWGRVLAASHARADKDFDNTLVPSSVEKEISLLAAGRKSEFRKLVRITALFYADQVQADWQLFLEALAPSNCPAP